MSHACRSSWRDAAAWQRRRSASRSPRAAGIEAAVVDRDGALEDAFRALKPDVVVDCSGPFQAYRGDPYRVVRACLALGISYLDLADGSAFVEGIAQFDAEAKARGVVVLSGASTFPVLSTAVVQALSAGWHSVREIVVALAPSPHIDLGRSVIGAIASYAGKPVRLWRGGRVAEAPGMIEARRFYRGRAGDAAAVLAPLCAGGCAGSAAGAGAVSRVAKHLDGRRHRTGDHAPDAECAVVAGAAAAVAVARLPGAAVSLDLTFCALG